MEMRVRKERTCKLSKRGEVHREEEARSPPNDWALEVAGSTEKTVCESVGITRIQPTPKSFQVDTINVVTLQGVDLWKNCAAQDSSESSPASSGCVRQMGVRRARMQNVVCCNHTWVKYVAITWACCTWVAVVRSPEGSWHRSHLLGPRP
jgi:hypothetical protein